jgi:hypothetical protein
MKSYRNNWVNYLEIVEIPENMAVGADSYALETAKGDRGNKVFELSNHLGNVLATVSDKKLGRVLDSTSFVAAYYDGQVRSVQDYYAFGWTIPSRKFNSNNYRFGFNNQEKSEVAEGNTTALFWEYDARAARRWNIDPKPIVSISPYSVLGSNPILNLDVMGDTAIARSSVEAQQVADDLNRIYKAKYKFDNAFSITEYTVETKSGGTVVYSALTANPKFDWGTDKYTKALYGLIAGDSYVIFDIEPDENGALMNGYGGGFTKSRQRIRLSARLLEHNYGDKGTGGGFGSKYWTLGGVFLHEMLYHVHKVGQTDDGKIKYYKVNGTLTPYEGPNIMRIYYMSKTGKNHGSGNNQNYTFGYYGDKPVTKKSQAPIINSDESSFIKYYKSVYEKVNSSDSTNKR